MVSVLQERWTRENGICVTRKIGECGMVSVLQERWTRENGICYKKDRRVRMVSV